MSFANGKIILSGEHSVVYGEMALSASIMLGVTARVVNKSTSQQTDLLKLAIEKAGGDPKIEVEVDSQLPIGSGLGSSAAVSAATIRAVREHLGIPILNDELRKLVWDVEKFFSPRDSGLDSTVVTYGGVIEYIKGQELKKLEVGKTIKILLVNSGKPSETTGEMVNIVSLNQDNSRIIKEIGKVTQLVKNKMMVGDNVNDLLNQNGFLLENLGVVSDSAIKLSNQLRNEGASVKITGAGGVKTGSGMMIVLHEDLTQIMKLLDNMQIDYFETVVGGR